MYITCTSSRLLNQPLFGFSQFFKIFSSSLTQLDCWQCYRPLAKVVIHLFTLNVVAFSGSLTGNWATYHVGYIKIIPSFLGAQPMWCSCSVPCPSYPLIRVLLSFPSLTGGLTSTKPVCLIGANWRIQVEIDQILQFVLFA